jgi:hypothetical protein
VSLWKAYPEGIIFSFRKQKELAEKAFRQVEDQYFFKKPGEHSNSIAIVIKHVAGRHRGYVCHAIATPGMRSRCRGQWTERSPSDAVSRVM